jgi:hypothetical protein
VVDEMAPQRVYSWWMKWHLSVSIRGGLNGTAACLFVVDEMAPQRIYSWWMKWHRSVSIRDG